MSMTPQEIAQLVVDCISNKDATPIKEMLDNFGHIIKTKDKILEVFDQIINDSRLQSTIESLNNPLDLTLEEKLLDKGISQIAVRSKPLNNITFFLITMMQVDVDGGIQWVIIHIKLSDQLIQTKNAGIIPIQMNYPSDDEDNILEFTNKKLLQERDNPDFTVYAALDSFLREDKKYFRPLVLSVKEEFQSTEIHQLINWFRYTGIGQETAYEVLLDLYDTYILGSLKFEFLDCLKTGKRYHSRLHSYSEPVYEVKFKVENRISTLYYHDNKLVEFKLVKLDRGWFIINFYVF